MSGAARARKLTPWFLAAVAALGVLSVVLQFRFIHPFRRQTPEGLAIGTWLRDAAPGITLAALIIVVGIGALTWRSVTLRGKLTRAGLAIVALLAVVGARVNVFERMFAPLPAPRYVAAADATMLADDDMVLAVVSGGEAVAYPVRLLAYHHLVHDAVGGRALVATY